MTPALFLKRASFPLALFTVVISLVVTVFLNDPVHFFVSSVLLVSIIILSKRNLLSALSYYLVIFFVVSYMNGFVRGYYEIISDYDVLVHMVASFTVAYVAGDVLSKLSFSKHLLHHSLFFILVITCIGTTVGAWWEVFEWVAQLFVPHNLIAGVDDTIADLAADSISAFIAAIIVVKNES